MKSNEVYKITNTITNKIYIGITTQGSGTRFRHHVYEARSGEPSPIHKSMAKYGEDKFKLEIIDFADTSDELKEKEKYWIAFYNSTDSSIGYNLTKGGDGTFGRTHSEETKEKIRQAAIGRKASDETRKRMSESRKGKFTDRAKEHLAKIISMGKRPVIVYAIENDEEKIIQTFPSVIECAAHYDISRDTIRNAIKKRNGYVKKVGLYFKFEKENRYNKTKTNQII